MNENNHQPPLQRPDPPSPPPGEGHAIASLVFGIIATAVFFFNWCIPLLEVAIGITGIVFAILAKNKGYKGGKQSAGMILSIFAVSSSVIFWGSCICIPILGEILGGLGVIF